MSRKLLSFILLILTLITISFTPPALAADTANGAKIFNIYCAGCHINGGNIVRRGKNLKMKALKKYGYDSIEAITEIVSNGKNNMSAYKERLSEEKIQDVAAYVLEQAENGWR
jgi:cytochrome c6